MFTFFEDLNTESKKELLRIKKVVEELEKEKVNYPELEELKQEAEKRLLGIDED